METTFPPLASFVQTIVADHQEFVPSRLQLEVFLTVEVNPFALRCGSNLCPGIMNTVLAGQHSPCNEDEDFGDHLDWGKLCARQFAETANHLTVHFTVADAIGNACLVSIVAAQVAPYFSILLFRVDCVAWP